MEKRVKTRDFKLNLEKNNFYNERAKKKNSSSQKSSEIKFFKEIKKFSVKIKPFDFNENLSLEDSQLNIELNKLGNKEKVNDSPTKKIIKIIHAENNVQKENSSIESFEFDNHNLLTIPTNLKTNKSFASIKYNQSSFKISAENLENNAKSENLNLDKFFFKKYILGRRT